MLFAVTELHHHDTGHSDHKLVALFMPVPAAYCLQGDIVDMENTLRTKRENALVAVLGGRQDAACLVLMRF
jgi:hypothetical protein